MNGLQIKNVDFHGGEILGVKTVEGKIYMGVRQACRDIGLTDGQARRQVENIKDDIVLSKGVTNLRLPTNGGIQEVLGIEVGFIPLWLAKISITPNMQKENPKTVERLIKYQLEAKDVLEQVFIEKKQIIPNNLSPELQVLIGLELKQKELETAVTETKEEIASVKENIIVDYNDWRKWANDRVKAIGATLGDYRRAYNESYDELEERAKCNLKRRLQNKVDRLKKSGAGKKKINNTNYLDIIGEDKRLQEIYTSIVKEMCVKYL